MIGAGSAILQKSRGGEPEGRHSRRLINNRQARRSIDIARKKIGFKNSSQPLSKKSITGSKSVMDLPEPLHGQLMQTTAHRIANRQRPNQRRAAHRCTEDYPEMSARVKAEAANDERAEGHA
jgi:hypothetical protein